MQPAGSGSTRSGGEAMDCDDDGRDCVGDTGTRRRDRRVRGWGDGGGEEGRDDRV